MPGYTSIYLAMMITREMLYSPGKSIHPSLRRPLRHGIFTLTIFHLLVIVIIIIIYYYYYYYIVVLLLLFIVFFFLLFLFFFCLLLLLLLWNLLVNVVDVSCTNVSTYTGRNRTIRAIEPFTESLFGVFLTSLAAKVLRRLTPQD